MANTKPCVDNEETLRYVLEEGRKTPIHVLSCGTVTVGMERKELTDMDGLRAAGAAGFTDDGKPLQDERLVQAAMEKAGVTPQVVPIRGGTDGARLSYMGLPCPNLSTGGVNFHGVHEYIPVESLEKMVEVLINLVTVEE